MVGFAQKGSRDFLLIVDTLTGFLLAFVVRNKSTSEAVNKSENGQPCSENHIDASQISVPDLVIVLQKNSKRWVLK